VASILIDNLAQLASPSGDGAPLRREARAAMVAALELTGDNRASAAELLGLSRQSLYVKLRRYGLGDLATNEQD